MFYKNEACSLSGELQKVVQFWRQVPWKNLDSALQIHGKQSSTRALTNPWVIVMVGPTEQGSNPEWVCGCAPICYDVGSPRCFFRSHNGNGASQRVQSQVFGWQFEQSQPVLNGVVKIRCISLCLFKNYIILRGIIVCLVGLR